MNFKNQKAYCINKTHFKYILYLRTIKRQTDFLSFYLKLYKTFTNNYDSSL